MTKYSMTDQPINWYRPIYQFGRSEKSPYRYQICSADSNAKTQQNAMYSNGCLLMMTYLFYFTK